LDLPRTVEETRRLLASGRYVADASLATAVFLSLRLGRPLLLEGEAGVGKTEVAKVLAETLGRRLIRLQCYEGLDASAALYEWNYPRQMLEIRLAELGGEGGVEGRARVAHDIFGERFLLKRPLLLALEAGEAGPPVLLIDELDRTDEPFEAFLLEILSDFQVTIPEVGTVRAPAPPIVVLTSNRTREIHDALKRRCLYHWIGYPDAARELEVLRVRAPELSAALAEQIVRFVQRLRAADLFKLPGVAETIDWAYAILALDKVALDPDTVNATLGVLLKYQDDIEKMTGRPVREILGEGPTAEAAAAPPVQ
jgi:MoxR-like ATPase